MPTATVPGKAAICPTFLRSSLSILGRLCLGNRFDILYILGSYATCGLSAVIWFCLELVPLLHICWYAEPPTSVCVA